MHNNSAPPYQLYCISVTIVQSYTRKRSRVCCHLYCYELNVCKLCNLKPGEEPGNETGEEPGIETGEEPGNETGEEPGIETGEEPGNETGEEPGNETGGEPGNETGEEPGIETGEEPGIETNFKYSFLLLYGDEISSCRVGSLATAHNLYKAIFFTTSHMKNQGIASYIFAHLYITIQMPTNL